MDYEGSICFILVMIMLVTFNLETREKNSNAFWKIILIFLLGISGIIITILHDHTDHGSEEIENTQLRAD